MFFMQFGRKLLSFVNGCPYLIILSIIFHVYCSAHLGAMVYLLYMYTYRSIKRNYSTNQERLKTARIELEDTQLQMEIVKTKMCVFEAELIERIKPLQRQEEQLRIVRGRVAELIASDEALQQLLRAISDCNVTSEEQPPEEQSLEALNNKIIMGLLDHIVSKNDKISLPEMQLANMECGEHVEESLKQNPFSSMNDADGLQDCRVKIVKVTNVYKVAYLKHYIKQKRMRRANKHALLLKKMESIKKLLENWQKTLNMVINSKFVIDQNSMDTTSQEAMGDYSKPSESSGSDSDLRNSDMFYNEYKYKYEHPEASVSRCNGSHDINAMYTSCNTTCCDLFTCHTNKMVSIIEETGSQLAIENNSETHDDDTHDNIAI